MPGILTNQFLQNPSCCRDSINYSSSARNCGGLNGQDFMNGIAGWAGFLSTLWAPTHHRCTASSLPKDSIFSMRSTPTSSRDGSFAHSHIAELKIEMKIGPSAASNKFCPSLSLIVASDFVDLFVHRQVDSSLAVLSYIVIFLTRPRTRIRLCAAYFDCEFRFSLVQGTEHGTPESVSRRIK